MQNYTILKEIGSGTYGTVYQAQHNQTRQIVAIKKIHQKSSWDQAKNLVELKSFKKIREHQNLVTLYELFREKDGTLYFVFELINAGSLYDFILKCQKVNKPPTEQEVRQLSYQMLLGLAHIHNNDFIHRDLKLENVLLNYAPNGIQLQHISQPAVCKIADLGCAKETRTRFTQNTVYTGTRWYRSIELLMRDTKYGKPNDVWAIGCIIFEIFVLRPLFPGQSELDMLHSILQTFGPLYEKEWPEYQLLATKMNFMSTVPCNDIHYSTGASHTRIKEKLQNLIRNASSECIDCLAWMFELNPDRRWDVNALLTHPWFKQENIRSNTHIPTQQQTSNKYGAPSENDLLQKARLMLNQAKPDTISQFTNKPSHMDAYNNDYLDQFNIKEDKRSQSTFVKQTKNTIQPKKTKDILDDNDELDANLNMLDDMDY